MRLIDADALIDEAIERYCENCDKRKGMKNGKWKIVYQIGDAPCRACDVDDMKCDIEDAPTVQPGTIRCKDCKYALWEGELLPDADIVCTYWESDGLQGEDFCSQAERRGQWQNTL